MTIQDGYASQPLEIKVSPHGTTRMAEVWIEQFDSMKFSDYGIEGDNKDDDKFRTETLAYANLTELLELRDLLNETIQELVK